MTHLKTVLVLTSSLWAVAVHAQTSSQAGAPPTAVETEPSAPTSEPSPDAKQTPTTGGIEDIVVTAQRREERLQNVPIAVTSLSGAQLAASGVASTQDIVALTPALNISTNIGFALPRLRGVGTQVAAPGLENSVATYIDGVYIANARASSFSFAGIDRVEVLKGPQGTLFGRNATGGLIQVVTALPGQQFGGTLSASYGNYDTVTGDVYLTGGLTDTIAASVSGHVIAQGDGYGRNVFLGSDANRTKHDALVRAQLYFTSGGTSIRLVGDFNDSDGNPSAFETSRFYRASPFGVANQPRARDQNTDLPSREKFHGGGLSATVRQDLDFAELVSITAYRESRYNVQFDVDFTPVTAFNISWREFDRQFSQELQLVSGAASRIKWLVGAFYFDAAAGNRPFDLVFGPPLQPAFGGLGRISSTSKQDTESYAGFAQVTVPLTNTLNLTGGLRYTDEDRAFANVQTLSAPNGAQVGVVPRTAPGRASFSKLTFRASIDNKFTPDILGYASFNRGFKSGGFNTNGGLDDPGFQPEVLDAYEVGIKADLLGRRLRLNPSFYYYDYSNLQVTSFNNGSPLVTNGPKATIYGLDLDFVAAPTDRLTLRGGVSLIHDRFGNYPDAPAFALNPGGVAFTAEVINAKGNRIPLTSDFTSTLAADYEVPTRFGKALLNVTWNHNDGYFTEVDNRRRQGSFDLIDASVRVDLSRGLFASVWGRNLLDKLVMVADSASNIGSAVFYQPPRTYGVTVGAKF